MQHEEHQPLIPQPLEEMASDLTILQTLGQIYTLLRGISLPKLDVFNQRPEEEAIKKASLDFQLTLHKDIKAARNFVINALRDVILGIFSSLVLASLRKDESINIGNILTIVCAVVVAALFVVREIFDVKNEFIQNAGTRQKAILDAQAYHKKAQGLEEKLRAESAKLADALEANTVLSTELNALRQENIEVKLEKNSLKKEISGLKEEHNTIISKFQKEVKNLETRIGEMQQDANSLSHIKDSIAALAPLPKRLEEIAAKLSPGSS